MKKDIIVTLLGAVIVLTFLYTASDKLIKFNDYTEIMGRQPLPAWSKPILIWGIPSSEFIVSMLLFIPKTRRLGFVGATILMILFTGYIGLALIHAFKYVPCICGGIFRNMSWENHFLINVALLAIAASGWFFNNRSTEIAKTRRNHRQV
ncbi:MauE/DoxX family redox-associated membrane protein [Chitinophaga filiformis]|uniref:MauE/DoxX family redox-associated membrane protein n=1 Tax=Chitinophaga filiformis TaxID=104663 RepID=UPI00397D8415